MKRFLVLLCVIAFVFSVRFLHARLEEEPAPSEVAPKALRNAETVLSSSPGSDHIIGYAGPTPLLIGIDKDGRITGVHLLKSDESPGFVENIKMAGYMKSWDGKDWREAMTFEVDAVTGATATAKAIGDTLRNRLKLFAGEKGEEDRSVLNLDDTIAISFAFIALIFCIVPGRISRMARNALLAFSVIYLGIMRGMFLSVALLAGWIENGIAWKSMTALGVIALLAIAVPLVTRKPYYCYYVCPFGSLQELIYKFSKLHVKEDLTKMKILIHLRKVILLVIAVIVLFDTGADLTNFEPFTVFLFHSASLVVLAIAAVSCILSLFVARPWCHYFCPTGAFLDLFRTS